MPNDLETTIHKIILEVAGSMAREISHHVRQSIAAEISGSRTTAAKAPAAPARRPGRPPGSRNGKAAVVVSVAAAKRKPGRRGGVTESDVSTVYDFIGKHPGLRTEELFRELGGEPSLIKKALAKLRDTGRVTVKGIKRGATYTAAGSAAPSKKTAAAASARGA